VSLKDGKDGAIEAWFDRRKIMTFAGPDAKGRSLEVAERLNSFYDQVPELFDVTFKDDTVVGQRQSLFRVTKEDAAAAKTTPEELAKQSATAIQRSLFLLAYRVWDTRG
jgi:hypothetical protein